MRATIATTCLGLALVATTVCAQRAHGLARLGGIPVPGQSVSALATLRLAHHSCDVAAQTGAGLMRTLDAAGAQGKLPTSDGGAAHWCP